MSADDRSPPGFGPNTASTLAASIGDPSIFKNGREMASSIGLVQRQTSSGGKQRMGRNSKQGDHYLRWLLVSGAMAVIRNAKRKGTILAKLSNPIRPMHVAAQNPTPR